MHLGPKRLLVWLTSTLNNHSFEKLHDEQGILLTSMQYALVIDILLYIEKGAEVDEENNCE